MTRTDPGYSAPALAIATEPVTLTAKEFAVIADLARDEFGLELGKGKEQLVASRMGKLMRQQGFQAFQDFYKHMLEDRTGESLIALIDVLTTNHTSFFREQAHFDFLREVIFPQYGSRESMRIWCAASSTGEEPYTIAITAREHWGPASPALPSILATDISTRVLEAARQGIYRADRFGESMPVWLKKYLLRGQGRWEGSYRIKPDILNMVQFRRLNLIEPFPDFGKFQVIFCRNVMIYFSRETQEQLVARLSACLEPGGYLMVGHSESLTGIRHGLNPVQPAVYRKPAGRK